MNRKSKIIVSIVGITIVALALLGITYAYYLTRIEGNTNTNSISVTTADLKLVYADGSPNVVQTNIEPNDTVYEKIFTVYNDGNSNINYGVYFIDVINTFERKDDVKYTMECTTNGTLPCGVVEDEATFPSGISELATATIESKKTHTYTFKFTYKDTGTDQSVDMNKELQAKIQIFVPNNDGEYYPYEEGTLAYNIINNAINRKNGTLLVDTPPTKVAEEKSSDNWDLGIEENIYYDDKNVVSYAETDVALHRCYDGYYDEETDDWLEDCSEIKQYTSCTDDVEGKYVWDEFRWNVQYVFDCENGKIVSGKTPKYETVLSTTQDDYGISYYFRGNVEDNYVSFSNKCWRIVRIEGDGSIKLILESQSLCSETMTSNYLLGSSNWGYYYNANNHLVGDYNNSSGANVYATTSMKNKLDTWFKSEFMENDELTSAGQKIKTEEWCLNDKVYTQSGTYPNYTYTLLENPTYTGDLNNLDDLSNFYFDSYVRLSGKTTKEPTLKCSGEKDISKIGTLTADEIVFAGGIASYDANSNYYLFNGNLGDGYWWTLSLAAHEFVYDRPFMISDGGFDNSMEVSFDAHVRPSVTLKTGIKVTGGEGTKGNPYIINEG